MSDSPKTTAQNKLKQPVKFVTVSAGHAGQRIDNFLMRELKDVPRSYVYRILRKGEVRVNKKRIKPTYKIQLDDVVRIPPIFLPDKKEAEKAPSSILDLLKSSIVLEDDSLIFINKPSGMAVHGGSGVRYGLIESFRQLRQDLPFVELVHRLDKETSGLVMLAKNRQSLLSVHELLKNKTACDGINKTYLTLVKGEWQGGVRHIKNTLQRQQGKQQKVRVLDDKQKESGEEGKDSESIFTPVKHYKGYTLLEVQLLTGRMHQIRTQLADLGHPILGDSQYGDFALNREVKKSLGLKRLYLHAFHLKFKLNNEHYDCQIPLADDLQHVLDQI